MNIQGLIERYEKFKASKKKMTSVDLVLKDLRSLDEPEPFPFKLKNVVRRIRGFDPTTQTRWLNDILKELGDDYGSMKYRSGKEKIGDMFTITVQNYGIFVVTQTNYESLKIGDEVRL